MKSRSLCVVGALAIVVSALNLAGCASNRAFALAEAGPQSLPDSAELPGYRIRNWSALNDHTLIVEASDGTRYKAETMGPCLGLGFSNRVGFYNRGGFQQIDRFSSLVLPDGTRCSFQSFNRVVAPESSALDSFERLGNER
ncbi:MAG TPA: DUF6491 family protein [Steroidobacteraceae bacterium]|jgi:hypothetical protein|nr:DUF6491 family protein [Steroidobacteraceae bacterium]